MSNQLADQLALTLRDHQSAGSWCVAFSGGLDSTVLLHLLVGFCRKHGGPELRAIHIHHGLQEAAEAWPEHCRTVCGLLDVPLQVIRVQVPEVASIEQAARDARYVEFARQLKAGETLMLAQHQDDQSETLLLRLLRGSGVAGLQGMPWSRPLGAGQLLRPLLGISRAQLEAYAHKHGLSWIEDPSNSSDTYDRNLLRNRIMPGLRQRWPALNTVLARTAAHMQQAQGLLEELAAIDLRQAATQALPDWLPLEALSLDVIDQLSIARQTNLLRYWLRDKTAMPNTAHWAGWQALLQAGANAQPLWQLQDGALVRHGRRLYWLPLAWQKTPPDPGLHQVRDGEYLLPDNGLLQIAGLNTAPLRIGYRQGGEQMELPGRGRRDLKRLLQERQIPAFLRGRLPLLFAGEQLVAVAGLPELRPAEYMKLKLDWTFSS